jgi:hypothetical protein
MVRGINTTGSLQGETWADGDIIYLSPTVAGGITKVKPTAPDHSLQLGYVVYAHINNGKIFVKVDNGYEIGELHDVYVPTPSNNDGIFWNTANSRYQNNSISGILGYTPQAALTLTTTGSSGAATLTGATLNIPQYSGTNIYNADGTLTADRVLNNSTFLLQFKGGQVTLGNEETALRLETSTTSKELIFSLNNLSGKNWLIRSLANGNLDFRNITNLRTSFTLDSESPDVTFYRNIKSSLNSFFLGYGAFHNSLALGKTSVTAANYSIAENGAETMINADTGGLLRFRIANADKMMLTNAGRLLLGTTTESTYLLDVNGTARIKATSTSNVAQFVITDNASASSLFNFSGDGAFYVGKATYPSYIQGDVNGGLLIYNKSDGNSPQSYLKLGNPNTFGALNNHRSVEIQSSVNVPLSTSIITDLIFTGTINISSTGIGRGIYVNKVITSGDFRAFESSVGGGYFNTTSVNASAILQVDSTTKGFLPPRMTTTERNAIATPATGLQVYNTTTNENNTYNGTAWVAAGGSNIYNADGTLTGNRTVSGGGFTLTLNPVLTFGERLTGITDKTYTNSYTGTTTTNKSGFTIDNSTTQNGSIFYSSNSLYTRDYGTNTGALGSGLVGISSFNYNVSLRGLTPTALIQSRNYIQQIRDDSSDVSISSNNAFEGVGVYQTHWQTAGATISTGNFYGFNHATNIRSGTLVNNYSHRSVIDIGRFTSNATLVTNHYAFISEAIVGTSSGPTATITNYYGLHLGTPTVGVTGTITNRWGIYAPDVAMPHYLNGNLLLGTTTNSTYKLDVNGTARVSGAIFQSFGYLNSTINLISEGTTTTAGYRSVIIGHNTSMSYIAGTSANEAVVIGTINSSNYGNQIVAIGYNASVTSTYGVAIGSGATSSAGGVAIRGTESGNGIAILGTTSGSSGVALLGNNSAGQGVAIGGSSSVTSGAPSMAIGFKATSANNWGIALQMGVTRANNQFVAGGYETGSGNGWISEVYFGSGVVGDNTTTHSGRNYSINGSGSFGTNQTGGNITIAGGKGTGTGTSGDIIFSTSTALTTGTTLQSLTNRWWVKGSTGSFSNIASPNTSAIIQADSTTQGFLPPRMTAAQKTAIATPAEGLMIYQTDGVKGWWGYDGAAWRALAMI